MSSHSVSSFFVFIVYLKSRLELVERFDAEAQIASDLFVLSRAINQLTDVQYDSLMVDLFIFFRISKGIFIRRLSIFA